MVAANKAGLDRRLSADTIWLMNRQALADRWHTTPWAIEMAPAYEVQVALAMLEIEAEAERKRPKRR